MPLPIEYPSLDPSLAAALLDGVPCALGLIGTDDRLLFCNEGFVRLFDTPADDVRDRAVTDFVSPSAWIEACRHPNQAAVTGECIRRDGRTFPGELTVRPLAAQTGARRLLTLHALAPQRPLPSAAGEDHNLDGLATLAGGVAHEFNNVLTIVLGYGDLLPDMASEPERLRETVAHIMTAAQRGADVVYQLQLFARTKECPQSPHRLHQLVRDGVAHTARQWPATITVEFALCSGPDRLMLNAPQIILALQHLLQNAREALPLDCGRILLRTTHRPDLDPPQLCLSIEDTGIGMDETTRKHVIEPFFTRHRAGMRGLGLTVVHGIVKAHGGRIEITAPSQGGTHIHLWFPLPSSDPFDNTPPLSFVDEEREHSLVDTIQRSVRKTRITGDTAKPGA